MAIQFQNLLESSPIERIVSRIVDQLASILPRRLIESRYLRGINRLPSRSLNVLWLCKGNICRSPFAESLLRNKAKSSGIDLESISRGLLTDPGKPADPRTVEVSLEFGIDVSGHRTAPLTETDLTTADLLIFFELKHFSTVQSARPELRDKMILLGALEPTQKLSIADPFGRAKNEFQCCFSRIDRAITILVSKLSASR